ncbi:hypothetical protein HYH02_008354 [Chlamydomonas schloesseri]|uniref:ShKT domain-containing protein n=1 Tax=Chlamydomonas schloesseri TaxID=2026947 RepID=A0A835WGG2_9CHLO|nr:hypothetical protein HYH02_008354 [Chlamydomonas schloesseri]|eukprot:KAG2446794.1 hypothetical protein HYH02_008354 [Chlamydomonas schloesseri]
MGSERHGLLLLLALSLASWTQPLLAATDRDTAFETWTENPKACRDLESACNDWADKGECDKNPGFMHKSCRLSCKLCTAPEIKPSDYADMHLVLNTSLGQIRIRPLFDTAPATAALVLEAAANQPAPCRGCVFYRNEAVPPEGSSGPPYGLLQGSLAGLLKVPEHEGGPISMRRGHVAMIPSTREFFINVMDHESWGGSMTVWGDVADSASMSVVESALLLPYHDVKHPTFGTVMRMLDEQVPFSLLAVPADGSSSSSSVSSSSSGSDGEEEASATWTSVDASAQKRRSRRTLDTDA